MKTYARFLFAAVFLLFFVLGCSDNPVALDEAEGEVLLGKIEAGQTPLGYAKGDIIFKRPLVETNAGLGGAGGVTGKVQFSVVEVPGRPTGDGWFLYEETEVDGVPLKADQRTRFHARIKWFTMMDDHSAYFTGIIREGAYIGEWILVRIEDHGASEDLIRYRIVGRDRVILDVVQGDIICGWLPVFDVANGHFDAN